MNLNPLPLPNLSPLTLGELRKREAQIRALVQSFELVRSSVNQQNPWSSEYPNEADRSKVWESRKSQISAIDNMVEGWKRLLHHIEIELHRRRSIR